MRPDRLARRVKNERYAANDGANRRVVHETEAAGGRDEEENKIPWLLRSAILEDHLSVMFMDHLVCFLLDDLV
jgi:hypothetical protein